MLGTSAHDRKPFVALRLRRSFSYVTASFAATVAVFALQFASSCTSLSNNDDVLAVIQQWSTPSMSSLLYMYEREADQSVLEHDILNEIYRVLADNVDYSGDDPQQDRLFRNPMIRGCLSVQASFGFKGAQKHQTLLAKIASTTLNLRLASLTFAFMFNKPNSGSGGENDFTKPGSHSPYLHKLRRRCS